MGSYFSLVLNLKVTDNDGSFFSSPFNPTAASLQPALFLSLNEYLKLKALFSLWFSFHRLPKLENHLRSFWPEVFKLHFVAEYFVQMTLYTQNPTYKTYKRNVSVRMRGHVVPFPALHHFPSWPRSTAMNPWSPKKHDLKTTDLIFIIIF